MASSLEFTTVRAYDRLDQCLGEWGSRSAWALAIKDGRVSVDGKVCKKKSLSVDAGAFIEASNVPPTPKIPAENIDLDVLFEDEDLIVVNKPSGLVTHPAPAHPSGTLANALAARCDAPRCGIVHRLDKGTSGVIVAAKTPAAHATMSDAFRKRNVEKVYLAVCAGVVSDFVATEPIGRDPIKRDRMRAGHGRAAKSIVRRIGTDGRFSVCRVEIETGRTHQIRVHMSHRHHPILGDDVYGGGGGYERPMLHAWQLSLDHPSTSARLHFVAPPPSDLDQAIRLIAA
ncbi:hypothetical protein CTAYLR_005771 [Chrysophaeum taylorii]|uniref:Pseudouridine synthase n=1 Tax=Chrysophaeum taylorii TaxID=2483200 RepID=A0AAD7UI36_9STRA|nr:hypothetical protein CTAYLR_005771 [Chrysophaeum taylorii]